MNLKAVITNNLKYFFKISRYIFYHYYVLFFEKNPQKNCALIFREFPLASFFIYQNINDPTLCCKLRDKSQINLLCYGLTHSHVC